MEKITVIDIQHKTFKKVLTGYAPAEVDQFLDEIIESMEEDAAHRAALEVEVADLKDRISHFKSMEESLRNTLLLAQRTADETKASAHKEADLIKAQARMSAELEIATYRERADESRRETQRASEHAERARGELRSFLMTHLALLERNVPTQLERTPASAAEAGGAHGPTPLALDGATAPLAIEG